MGVVTVMKGSNVSSQAQTEGMETTLTSKVKLCSNMCDPWRILVGVGF